MTSAARKCFTPLQDDIGKALEAYAKAHNINVIIDGSQVPLVYAADTLDITRAFINDFNSKNPATAAVTRRHSNSSWRLTQFKDAVMRQLVPRPASLYSIMETILDSQAIQELLPHRYPFLLVDRIIELVPRERIVGIKQVSINEPFFQGHFPGAPVMPGVLVVEALAQVGAVLALREIEDRDQKLVLFTGIREARFRRPVVPGDTLIWKSLRCASARAVQRMRGEAKVDGQLVADADIMSIIADRGSAV